LQAWTLTEPLGNPASTRVQDMAALFDAAFRPDYTVRKSIIGFDHDYIHDTAAALEAGFGSLYWMEGVTVRLQVGSAAARPFVGCCVQGLLLLGSSLAMARAQWRQVRRCPFTDTAGAAAPSWV
jgi:hypothetical protein